MNDIASRLRTFEEKIKDFPCRLAAVSKTHPASAIQTAYEAGQRLFAENKVQEMAEKYEQLPKDIEWHLIGHLQRNKVKYIAPFVGLVHSVDSLKLLEEIDKQGQKHSRVIDCLLQIYIAREESKFGLSREEAEALLASEAFASMQHVRVRGLMGMASNTDRSEQVRQEFRGLKQLFEDLKIRFLPAHNLEWKEISMGMSGDYDIALEEGSTLIRVGSAIFGSRPLPPV